VSRGCERCQFIYSLGAGQKLQALDLRFFAVSRVEITSAEQPPVGSFIISGLSFNRFVAISSNHLSDLTTVWNISWRRVTMLPFLQLPPAVASAPLPTAIHNNASGTPYPPQSLRHPNPNLLQPRPLAAVPQDFLNYRFSDGNGLSPEPRRTNYLISPNTIPVIPVNRHPSAHGWTPSTRSLISPLLLTPVDPSSNESYVQQRSTSLGSFREVRIDSHTVHQRQPREPHEVLSEFRSRYEGYADLPQDHPVFRTVNELLMMNSEMAPLFRQFSLGDLLALHSLYLAIGLEMRRWLYPHTEWHGEEVSPNQRTGASLMISVDAFR
jgi:hypothetical protein